MAQEIELKLAFPPASRTSVLAALTAIGAERASPAQALINTYFDTADQTLSRARVALRTRKAGDVWLQTVKCAAVSQGGLSSRPEWEQAFTGTFDFSAIDVPEVQGLLEQQRQHIVPLFTTNFERDTFLYSPDSHTRIYLMVDSGEVLANGHTETISELELELAEGTPQALFALASKLSETLPLLPYDPSKAARGYRLFRNEAIHPVTIKPHLGAQSEAGFIALAQEALRAWAANQHGVITSADPEFVHQLRTGLRSLRTLVRLYKTTLPAGFADKWNALLAQQFNLLSHPRDLEVLREQTLPRVAATTQQGKLDALIDHAAEHACSAQEDLVRALSQPGSGRCLLEFGEALYALSQQELASLKPAQQHAQLRKSLRRVRLQLRQAQKHPSDQTLHALRISIKKLRYATEYLGPQTLGDKRTARNIRRLKLVLQSLGTLQDHAIALDILQAWSSKNRKLAQPANFVTGWITATNLQLMASILPRCVALLKAKRWHSRSGKHR